MPASSIPGPRGALIAGNFRQFGADPLGFLTRCAEEHGDYVPLRFFHRRLVLLNSPADIEVVLASSLKKFRKTLGYRSPVMRRLFGQGLLTSEGEMWVRQRRLAQPAFHRDRISGYGEIIVRFAGEMLAGWRDGQDIEIHAAMMRLTTRVVTRTLFNAEVPEEINRLGQTSGAVLTRFTSQFSSWRLLLNLLPSPTHWRFEKAVSRVEGYLYQLIRERRASGKDEGDLLSMLLAARDEDGKAMSDQQLRDELFTLMAAGLDTTALALSWGAFLLAKHPAVQDRLAAEVDSVLAGRAPGFADLPRLPFTEKVVKEAMRLYPPAWLVAREAIEPAEVAGHAVEKGQSFLISQWVAHRNKAWFPEPLAFRPERWTEEFSRTLPKFAYFPFGGGPRICIGQGFAMMEAILVLACALQRFRFEAAPDYAVEPQASITLQPKGGIHLRLRARPSGAAA